MEKDVGFIQEYLKWEWAWYADKEDDLEANKERRIVHQLTLIDNSQVILWNTYLYCKLQKERDLEEILEDEGSIQTGKSPITFGFNGYMLKEGTIESVFSCAFYTSHGL